MVRAFGDMGVVPLQGRSGPILYAGADRAFAMWRLEVVYQVHWWQQGLPNVHARYKQESEKRRLHGNFEAESRASSALETVVVTASAFFERAPVLAPALSDDWTFQDNLKEFGADESRGQVVPLVSTASSAVEAPVTANAFFERASVLVAPVVALSGETMSHLQDDLEELDNTLNTNAFEVFIEQFSSLRKEWSWEAKRQRNHFSCRQQDGARSSNPLEGLQKCVPAAAVFEQPTAPLSLAHSLFVSGSKEGGLARYRSTFLQLSTDLSANSGWVGLVPRPSNFTDVHDGVS